jgi:hypothetical protein
MSKAMAGAAFPSHAGWSRGEVGSFLAGERQRPGTTG